jgi:hypothetical protein
MALTRTVILLGTSHRVQGAERRSSNIKDPDYDALVRQLSRTFAIDFLFEEASGLGPTFAEKFAMREMGPNRYKDIDPSAEYRRKLGITETSKDYRIGNANLDTGHWGYGREELIDAQEQRECFWLPSIREQDFSRALLICGHAHLLSFAFRLKAENFEVRAYSYMPYKLLALPT